MREIPGNTPRAFTLAAALNGIQKGAIAKSWLTNWSIELGLLLILTVFALLQGWAIHRIVIQSSSLDRLPTASSTSHRRSICNMSPSRY